MQLNLDLFNYKNSKNCDSFLIFAKTQIVGTCRIPRTDSILIQSTHTLYFRAKKRNNVYPCKPQFYIKVGCKGV